MKYSTAITKILRDLFILTRLIDEVSLTVGIRDEFVHHPYRSLIVQDFRSSYEYLLNGERNIRYVEIQETERILQKILGVQTNCTHMMFL